MEEFKRRLRGAQAFSALTFMAVTSHERRERRKGGKKEKEERERELK